MSFRDFVENSGRNMGESRTSLAFVAMNYAKHLRLPNVCSISSNVFTHGDLVFDPGSSINARFYNDPNNILQIVPSVAKRTGFVDRSGWFDSSKEDALLGMLATSVHAWILFSLNPHQYGRNSYHQVGLTNQGRGYFDVWDTARSYPNEVMNEKQVWAMCQQYLYGDKPVAITFS